MPAPEGVTGRATAPTSTAATAPTTTNAPTSATASLHSGAPGHATAAPEAADPTTRRRDPTGDLYPRSEVARLFGIPETRLRSWDRSGFLSPSARVGARSQYTFQDLIGVRTAKALLDRGVPLRRVRTTIDALRTSLPEVVRPLSELRVIADGQSVVVRDERSLFEPPTGQTVIDFEVRRLHDDVVRVLRPGSVDPSRRRAAYEAYLEGCRLDEDEATLDRAEAAYRRAISLDPSLANALTNLGNLRFRRGDAPEAQALYQHALALDADQPEAWYNLGFLAFEKGEVEVSVKHFERAVGSDPGFADAHFNLAMSLTELGRIRDARGHWEAYLELDPQGSWADIARRHLGLRG